MSYIGNTSTTQSFAPAIDYFSGDGSTVAFTLSRSVASVAQVQVVVNNVPQNPSTAFTVLNSTITFTGAPSSGTNNIYVEYVSPITQVIAPGQGTVGLSQLTATGTASSSTFLRGDNTWAAVSVTPTAVSDQDNTSTGYFDLPSGTTAQRPASPSNGMVRYNTSNSEYEVYQAGVWKALTTQAAGVYSIDALVVAGGGSGGGATAGFYDGGGGGAGGYQTVSTTVTALTAYTVTVGAGGTGSTTSSSSGSASSISSVGVSSVGGGAGGYGAGGGSSGGSGGGGSHPNAGGGSGTSGQGSAGGSGGNGGPQYGAGGGGGASAGGGTGNSSAGGAGGAGSNWQSLGTTYAGGGGGGVYGGSSAGAGGAGGGGNGGANSNGTAGTANRGAGGGGAAGNGVYAGGSGGSGIVIIRYLGSQRGSGGTVTSAGGYTYHTFTSSGTYTA